MFGDLAAKTTQNGAFDGAATEKDDANEGRNAPGPVGSGASKTLCVQCFRADDIHAESTSLFFENLPALHFTKMPSGLQTEHVFAHLFFVRTFGVSSPGSKLQFSAGWIANGTRFR